MFVIFGFFLILNVVFILAQEDTSLCTDSDNGTDISILGKTGSDNLGYSVDQCMIRSVEGTSGVGSCSGYDCFILEHYCNEDFSEVLDDLRGCPDGCSEGVCIGTIVAVGGVSSCIDSDNGKDYFKKGVVKTIDSYGMVLDIREDQCLRDNQDPSPGKEEGLFEIYCGENNELKVTSGENLYLCPNGCEDGACVNGLSEGRLIELKSKNLVTNDDELQSYRRIYYAYGLTSVEERSYDVNNDLIDGDFVDLDMTVQIHFTKSNPSISNLGDVIFNNLPDEYVSEKSCNEEGCSYIIKDDSTETVGAYWVSENKIVLIFLKKEEYYKNYQVHQAVDELIDSIREEYPLLNLNETVGEKQTPSTCQLGYRKDGSYCNENFEMISQKVAESACDNNFECESNLCIDSQCISGSLWTKFMNWLKRIF